LLAEKQNLAPEETRSIFVKKRPRPILQAHNQETEHYLHSTRHHAAQTKNIEEKFSAAN
jgi:hypothetical protein